MLYKEKSAYKVAETVSALDALFPANSLPATFRNPILTTYANAIWQCSTAVEAAIILNEAVGNSEAQAKNDEKIIDTFADMMAGGGIKPDVYYDVSMLAYPKETILEAIEREILREPLNARVELLKGAAAYLTSFQAGIGSAPLYLLGVHADKLPRTLTEARVIAKNVDVASLRRVTELAKIEGTRIMGRMDAAVRRRNSRLSAALVNAL